MKKKKSIQVYCLRNLLSFYLLNLMRKIHRIKVANSYLSALEFQINLIKKLYLKNLQMKQTYKGMNFYLLKIQISESLLNQKIMNQHYRLDHLHGLSLIRLECRLEECLIPYKAQALRNQKQIKAIEQI